MLERLPCGPGIEGTHRDLRAPKCSLCLTVLVAFFSLALCLCGCGSGGAPATAPPGADARLSALVISAGAITPVFASGTIAYTLTTSSGSTTVTPTVNQANATVTVDGAAVASGAASASIPLAVGTTAISVVATAQDSSTTQTYTVTVSRVASVVSLELLDPTPGASDQFGSTVVQLANGNIVISDPQDASGATGSGAVHLYSPLSSTPIASIYGDGANDQLGNSGVTALGNSNYVVVSREDDVGGVVDAGSVRLMNGTTGVQIAMLAGNVAADFLGGEGITALDNNNFVIASANDDVGGVVNAGSVRLVDGTTGVQIASLAGNAEGDQLGFGSITMLANNNYVIASVFDDEGGIDQAGSVRLVNGTTGVQIAKLAGDVERDQLGSSVTALGNNNYVVASRGDDEGGVVDAGSVRLMNGATGAQISMLAGDVNFDGLGAASGVTALGNNNYVIASANDDVGGVVDAGSVRLVNGTTGAQIAMLAGDVDFDELGTSGVTALGNNNYVIASANDDVGGIVDAGSVRLMNGATGVEIEMLAGDVEGDSLGSTSVTALGNNNFVIASFLDEEGGIAQAGSVRLVNGATGVQIAKLAGDHVSDRLGDSGVTALGNNNYVIASLQDDEGGIGNAGSVRLMNGTTGVQIAVLAGDAANDTLSNVARSDNSGVTALANSDYVVASIFDDEGAVVDAGSVRLVNGSTGAAIGAAIVGEVADDMSFVRVITPITGDYYILSQPRADRGGDVDAGMVRIVAP